VPQPPQSPGSSRSPRPPSEGRRNTAPPRRPNPRPVGKPKGGIAAPIEEAGTGERLQKVLAAHGVASRRAAEAIIRAGRVRVNGVVVREMGVRVNEERDAILLDDRQLRKQRLRYVLLHKPSGYITTVNDERGRWKVLDLVQTPERIFPVGRLDRDTEGLLLLTNDGEVANRVMHPRYGLEKEYHALVTPLPTTEAMSALSRGILLTNELGRPERTGPAKVGLLPFKGGEQWLRITIHEGRKRQVRRMLEAVGCDVQRLVRVRLGPLSLRGIPKGAWRELTAGERRELFTAVGLDNAEMPEDTDDGLLVPLPPMAPPPPVSRRRAK